MSTTTTTRLDAKDFIEIFEPHIYPGTRDYVVYDMPQNSQQIFKALAENRLWTMVEGEDSIPALVSGHREEGRHHSVITRLPYNPDIDYTVVDEEHGWQE